MMENEGHFELDGSMHVEWIREGETVLELLPILLQDEDRVITRCAILQELSFGSRRFAVVARWADLDTIAEASGGAESLLDVEVYAVSGRSGEAFDLVVDPRLLRDLAPLIAGLNHLEFQPAIA